MKLTDVLDYIQSSMCANREHPHTPTLFFMRDSDNGTPALCPASNYDTFEFDDIRGCHRIYCYGWKIDYEVHAIDEWNDEKLDLPEVKCIYVFDEYGMEKWCENAEVYIRGQLQGYMMNMTKRHLEEIGSISIFGYWESENTEK